MVVQTHRLLRTHHERGTLPVVICRYFACQVDVTILSFFSSHLCCFFAKRIHASSLLQRPRVPLLQQSMQNIRQVKLRRDKLFLLEASSIRAQRLPLTSGAPERWSLAHPRLLAFHTYSSGLSATSFQKAQPFYKHTSVCLQYLI